MRATARHRNTAAGAVGGRAVQQPIAGGTTGPLVGLKDTKTRGDPGNAASGRFTSCLGQMPPVFPPPTGALSSPDTVIDGTLGQHVLDHVAGDVGEAEITPLELVSQAPMVDAHKVKHGGVSIMNADGILDRVVVEIVSFTIRDARLDAAPSHPHLSLIHI